MTMDMQHSGGDGVPGSVSAAVGENRGWFIVLGLILILLGVIAIGAPILTTIAVKVFLGWLFLIAGIAQLVHAFSARTWQGVLGAVLVAILYVVVGGWLAFFPLTGVVGLTVLLAVMFVAEGAFKLVIGFQVRPLDGWFWIILSGILSFIIGALIFSNLPSSAAWAIGLLVGINMVVSGTTFLLAGLTARKAT